MEQMLLCHRPALVDIDFRRQLVGDTVIKDTGGNVWTPYNGGGVVVDDPILGRSMQLSGGYFVATLPDKLNLQTIPFLLEMTFRLTTGGILYATGDTTTSPKTAGLVLSAGVSTAAAEVTATPVDTNGGSTAMSTTGKWAANTITKFTYSARPGGGEVLQLFHGGVLVSSNSFTNHWAGRGSPNMAIGIQIKSTTAAIRGFIQSLKIRKTA